MTPLRAKTVWTVLITFAITLSLPAGAYFAFSHLMTRMITKDNATLVLDAFGSALDNGTAIVHDPLTAANVAQQAYREKMYGIPVDGWANPLRISAVITGHTCQMTVLSAGPDGAFGTADDLPFMREFDLTPRPPVDTKQ